MTKNEFLEQLHQNLSPLSNKDKERTISYYQELIDDQLESGKSESEIIASLENPTIIANKIKDELSQKEQITTEKQIITEEQPATKKSKIGVILAIILGFPIWFSLLVSAFSIVLSVFISIYSVALSLFVSSFAVGAFGALQVVASLFYFSISPIYAFSIIGMGLVAVGFSILLFYATYYLTNYILKFTCWSYKILKKCCILMLGGKNVKKN